LQHDDDFDWDNIKILDEESYYNKCLISEMLNIKKEKSNLNLQIDIEGQHKAYIPLINKIWHAR